MKLPIKGEKWKHFKGNIYEITDIVMGCDDDLVIRIVYTDGVTTWSRSLTNFMETVDGKRRFTLWEAFPMASDVVINDLANLATGLGEGREVTDELQRVEQYSFFSGTPLQRLVDGLIAICQRS